MAWARSASVSVDDHRAGEERNGGPSVRCVRILVLRRIHDRPHRRSARPRGVVPTFGEAPRCASNRARGGPNAVAQTSLRALAGRPPCRACASRESRRDLAVRGRGRAASQDARRNVDDPSPNRKYTWRVRRQRSDGAPKKRLTRASSRAAELPSVWSASSGSREPCGSSPRAVRISGNLVAIAANLDRTPSVDRAA